MDNKDKQALIDGTATIPYKLHILNDDGSIKDTLTEEDIVSTDYEDYRYVDSSSLCIGQFVARKLKGEIKTIDKDLQIEDKEISVEMGVNRNDGSKVYDITIDGKSEQATTKGTNLIGLDNNQYKVDLKIGDKLCVTNNGTTQLNLNLYTNYGDTARNDYFTIYANSKRIVSVLKDAKAIAWGGTIEGLVWVNKGEEQLPYEEYTGGQPSPSPDYPSEIKTVKGVRNLFDYEDESNYVETTNSSIEKINNGIRVTNKIAGTYKFAKYKIENNIVKTMLGKTYTFSCDFAASGSNNGLVAIYWSNSNNSTFSNISSLNISGNYITFTLPSEIPTGAEYISLLFYSNRNSSTIVVGDYVDYTNIQMTEGSITYDYVPYGSWLKVKNTGKNLFDKENAKIVNVYMDNTSGKLVSDGNFPSCFYIKCEENTTYTISRELKSRYFYVAYTTELPQANVNFYGRVNNYTGSSITITTGKNARYLVVRYYYVDDGYTKEELLDKMQVEQGSTATEYEPYKEQSTLIDMNKPNLFDNVAFVEGSSKYYSYDETTGITINKNDEYAWSSIGYKIQIGNNKQYKISVTNIDDYSTLRFGQFKSDGTWITAISPSSDGLITFNSDCSYVTLKIIPSEFPKTIGFITLISGCDDYYELSSIGDTKDELNIDKDGNVSITQNIGEVVLNGSENWAKNGNETVYYCTSNILGNIKQQLNNDTAPYLISTHFRTVAPSQMWTNPTNDLTITSFISKNNEPRIRYNAISTVDNFKSWLSTHPVTVKYILDKPQTISLGKYDKIEKIDDTENITIQTNIDTTFTKTSYNLINWYNFGNFLITKPTDDDVKDTLTFDSMDYTKKFNKSFDPSGITFPCTALQLAKYCCEECGVELATNEFLNYDFEVIDNQYTNEDTFRNVMQDIGKLAYSWIRIGWDNKCYIDFNYGEEVDEYNKIDNDNYYDLDLQQKQFGPVNRIVIGMSNVEGENVYIEDEKSIVEHGVTELQIYDNNLTYTPELRNKVIDSAKVLFGLTYTPMTLNTTGHPWLLGKEKVEVTGMNNTIYYTYPWDRTISYSGHIKSKLESKCDTKTETEYKYKGDVETVLKKTRIIVNKQENTITSLTQQTTSIQDNLQQNYYDITQTNQLIQTSSTGITNTFSEAGGNNVFRNTGLWFQETEENKWEYWTGTAKKTTNDKAVLGTSILLQNGTFSQEQEVPNGNYSISFYYKLLNPLAKATVKINDNTYKLTSTDYKQFYTGEQDENKQYITFPIEVTATHLNISFKTDIDNSVEVYDLMANKGTVKLAYSQNENEITTDTVNISKGITITSSVNDTKFKANADGIRIVDKNNDEKITEFTDKGMTTKEAIVEEEATIVQVLIQNIGDQTWFTRL